MCKKQNMTLAKPLIFLNMSSSDSLAIILGDDTQINKINHLIFYIAPHKTQNRSHLRLLFLYNYFIKQTE